MKQSVLFITFSLFAALSSNAQCTPDPQYTTPGFYPDSATGLYPSVFIDQIPSTYSETITYVVPANVTTLIGPFPATLTLDSVVLIGFTGLPLDFTYSCFDDQNMVSPLDGCAFEGATIGCIAIDGVPDFSNEGVHPISLSFEMYLEGSTLPNETFTIDYYILTIQHGDVWPPPPVDLDEPARSAFQAHPNPVAESFTLDGLDGLDISSISISNSEGKILRKHTDIYSSSYELNATDLEAGIYFIQIAYGNCMDVVRFIKK